MQSAKISKGLALVSAFVYIAEANVGIGYTKNSLCLQNNCLNPIVPGLEQFGVNVLGEYDQKTWTCNEHHADWQMTGICSKVVAAYPFAVPQLEGLDTVTSIKRQTKRAVETYVAHLNAMGRDWQDHLRPWEKNECIQEVWRMACFTHFPRCNELDKGAYLRPCVDMCQNYLKKCNVECCDEGVQCLFKHTKKYDNGKVVQESGYTDKESPSPFCTGTTQAAASHLQR
eukprot:TRINITY_DN96915_c0_g1_i1.p1 TRINITY_DN96915_c0_g1~~TRINITY_DN96915_c0_g1_i1.p1  ORF type:complete len:228 (-),score=41.27 TRINITY_DN96915_c0_g1_i1:111-794(-)